jgi:2-(1,2-epoxy-1,2-dihydrophenyl)acetyl-CoA isomerase
MTDRAAVRLDIQEGLATVTLTQPSRGNPIDGDFCREMKQVCLDLWDQNGLRAVLLRAEGPNFSFGGDLKTFYPIRQELAPRVRAWTADLHMGLQRLWQLPVPVVAEVQGFAMGGGVAVFAGADVVVAGQAAKIGSAFAHLGFSCDSGTSIVLTARLGAARAKRFVMLGEVWTAEQALQAGLVDKVVADDAVTSEALAMARRLAAGPTVAFGEIKRLFHRASALPMESLFEDEAFTLARVSSTQDAQEGIAAMVEKRKPVFQGR